MDSLRKSFKSYGSASHNRNASNPSSLSDEQGMVVVKIDDADPPDGSPSVGGTSGEGVEADDAAQRRRDKGKSPMVDEEQDESKRFSFSFQDSNLDPVLSKKTSESSSDGIEEVGKDEEGNENGLRQRKSTQRKKEEGERIPEKSFQSGTSSLVNRKPKSRLIDPTPPLSFPSSGEIQKKSGRLPPKSGQTRSNLVFKSGLCEEEDDDPFLDEDIPNELKKSKFDFVTFLQWLGLVVILASLLCTYAFVYLREKSLWGLHIWKWELLGFALICGRLISGWVVRIIVFFLERSFLLRKRVLYFVYGIRTGVQNSLWLGLVLLSWHFLFDESQIKHLKPIFYVTRVLLCLLVTALFHLGKTLLVKVLASSFHVSTYFDRIQEALFHQYIIHTLSGPPVLEMKKAQDQEEQIRDDVRKFQSLGYIIPKELQAAALNAGKGQKISTSMNQKKKNTVSMDQKKRTTTNIFSNESSPKTISIEQIYNLSQRNISAWNMKRLIRIVRKGSLTTLDEHIPLKGEDEKTSEIRSEYQAKIAAKKIFINVAKPKAQFIYLSDLLRFMRQAEAIKAMSLFEGVHEHNSISKKSLKAWVVSAFRERKALALTLNDTKTAVNRLNHMIDVIVGVIVFALWLIILGLAKPSFFALLGSQVLLAVFVFGNTLKTVFEAIVFLFVMHPFDVGDRCEVDDVQLVVEEMNIMTTVFLRYDNLKITYPNSVLATKFICNHYRSPDMGDSIDFCIHVATPKEKRDAMKKRMIEYIRSQKEHWDPNPQIVLRDVDDMNKLKVSLWFQHRMNYQDMGLRFDRRELVMDELIKTLKELDIEYRLLPFDVNVVNAPPVGVSRVPSTWSTFG
ncbi:hypothetical protein LUZ60_014499 [Juncus effusus]|nr:hypothetical protein LUZ60_014499 [Juncus effusus]